MEWVVLAQFLVLGKVKMAPPLLWRVVHNLE